MSWGYGYVPVAERQRRAKKRVAKMLKKGETPMPVVIDGRKIATTFWGKAWCDHLESYSDYANRLPRGRTYARNGSVVDLRIEEGEVRAIVSGSRIYRVTVGISPLTAERWAEVRDASRGQISSVIDLLQGKLSDGVMAIVTDRDRGLFPAPREITLDCTCPDWATMCKHVAATLYGVGARLDHAPELLFTLRGVDPDELIQDVLAEGIANVDGAPGRRLADDTLSEIFGVDIDLGELAPPSGPHVEVSPDPPPVPPTAPDSAAPGEDDDTLWLLTLIEDEPGLSKAELAETLGFERAQLDRVLGRLKRQGRVVFRGRGRSGGYFVAE